MASDAREQAARNVRRKDKAVGIPVRKLGQVYGDEVPTYWFRGNAFLTAYFSGFSGTFPEGEAQFIHSVRLFKDKIDDPVLEAQVRAFIGQEAQHSKEHKAFNEAMIARGFDLGAVEQGIKEMNAWARAEQTPEEQLAVTVCAEHLTAVMADFVLNKSPEVLEGLPKEARALWAWHAIEEIEHKAVAFEVYDRLVGDRDLLRRAMARTTAVFVYMTVTSALKMTLRRPERSHPRMWAEALRFLGGMARKSAKDYLAFYRRDFHPWQHDNRAALDAARRKYLGETESAAEHARGAVAAA